MVSFKHQIAFAAHILTLMATFFGLGYWLAQYVTDSTAVVCVHCMLTAPCVYGVCV